MILYFPFGDLRGRGWVSLYAVLVFMAARSNCLGLRAITCFPLNLFELSHLQCCYLSRTAVLSFTVTHVPPNSWWNVLCSQGWHLFSTHVYNTLNLLLLAMFGFSEVICGCIFVLIRLCVLQPFLWVSFRPLGSSARWSGFTSACDVWHSFTYCGFP